MLDDPKEGCSEQVRQVWKDLLELGPRFLASVFYLDPKPWTRRDPPSYLDRARRCNKITSTDFWARKPYSILCTGLVP